MNLFFRWRCLSPSPLNALENVQDMVLTAGGWLDFTRAWLPPAAGL